MWNENKKKTRQIYSYAFFFATSYEPAEFRNQTDKMLCRMIWGFKKIYLMDWLFCLEWVWLWWWFLFPLYILHAGKKHPNQQQQKSQRPFYLLPSDIGSNKHIFLWFPKMMPLFEFGRGAIMANTGTMDPLICTTIYDLSSSEPSEVRDERVHWLIPNALLKRPILPRFIYVRSFTYPPHIRFSS